MARSIKHSRSEIIEQVTKLVHKKMATEQRSLVETFVRQYYSIVAEADLNERLVTDLYGAVLSHWHFVYKREPDEIKVNVFNPQYEQHGWESSHTIIEVVHNNMPFLVDSLRMELNRYGTTIHFMIHPGKLWIKRDSDGHIEDVLTDKCEGAIAEAPIYAEIDCQTDPLIIAEIKDSLISVIKDVDCSVTDWRTMHDQAVVVGKELESTAEVLPKEEVSEVLSFINWIAGDNFTFLGYHRYDLVGSKGDEVLKAAPGTGLGLLRDDRIHRKEHKLTELSEEAKKIALSEQILIIAKTNTRSTVHRPAFADYIGIKIFNQQGKVIGEHRFIGLYTSIAYNSNPRAIPVLRKKVEKILLASGLGVTGYSGKELANILDTYPRDELFQASFDDLYETGIGILHLQERRRIRLFIREDAYGRFFSCLVYVPRERFNSELRENMGDILVKAFNGVEVNYSTLFSDSVLMRIHFNIRLAEGAGRVEYNVEEIEQDLITATRSWQDNLKAALLEHYGEAVGNRIYNKYAFAFPAGYRERLGARNAVHDIERMEALTGPDSLQMTLYRPLEEINGNIHFKLFTLDITMPLSDVLPVLEHMGLRVIGEHSYKIKLGDKHSVLMHDFSMTHSIGEEFEIDRVRWLFQEAFEKTWFHLAENDAFNKLVLLTGLSWRQVSVLRAYAKYFKQMRFTFSQSYIEEALVKHPRIVQQLVQLFDMRFNPLQQREADQNIEKIEASIIESLDQVLSLDEDRILRHYLSSIQASLRTNFYQKDSNNEFKTYLSIKFDPSRVPDMPLPKPMFEIFVYSPDVEGVHLRGGKVARGGLRWSDRREDFRTEVLGLMKAQQVKNSVIVPAGAKGGFVAKNLQDSFSREQVMNEVVSCYSTFIRGLLDITDNLDGDKVVHPENCIFYDEDDSYLVVAADKGTASFSDIANGIAQEYNFWLGDAFASGGSLGYDHKKMGITARGAWESVKSHFRELGTDIQETDFTVVGIGDMSGDVFGNGMLLSKHIKLIAAFNHLHIFIDPNPEPAQSFNERQRLFNLDRSSWLDYDQSLISKGGAIFSRTLKSIVLTPEIKKILNVKDDKMVPNDLISAILKAPVDLLWNGGIGTYVKAKRELDGDVGDRANDAVRVFGEELRCKVIGEGGNLGFTQLGRIEYNLNGGISNTDFIDNVGGVDCSDHEVNIKILLNSIVVDGDMTAKQRNELLEQMTDQVTKLVLLNNYRQAQSISLAALRSPNTVNENIRFIHYFERLGILNRHLEALPLDEELSDRKAQGIGLTRPELSILFAYSKISLKNDLLNSDIGNDDYMSRELVTAFPTALQKKFYQQMQQHRLRHEIIATQLSNDIIDNMGATFVKRLYDETGASTPIVAKSYTISSEIFAMQDLSNEINLLDNIINVKIQLKMRAQLIQLVRRGARWFLRNRRNQLNLSELIKLFAPHIAELSQAIPDMLVGVSKQNFEIVANNYINADVPESLARKIAATGPMFSSLDIIEAASDNKLPVREVAELYYLIGEHLELDWFRQEIGRHPVSSNWDALARAACRDDLDRQQRTLTEGVLQYHHSGDNMQDCIKYWQDEHGQLIERWQYMIADLKATAVREFTMFTVALRELLDLAQASRVLSKE